MSARKQISVGWGGMGIEDVNRALKTSLSRILTERRRNNGNRSPGAK